jgi:DNA-binding beta-propeller fold protein YncE
MRRLRLAVATVVALLAVGAGMAVAQQDDAESESSQTADSQPGAPAAPDPDTEVTSARTATSKTYRLSGGRLETRIYAAPVNYRDGKGKWRPIGKRLRTTEDGTLANGANAFDIHLPRQIDSGPVRLSVGEEWVASQLLGASTGTAGLEDGTARYEALDTGVSFDYRGTSTGLKEDIVLGDPSQPSSFAFELSASDGLAPRLEPDGGVVFRDAEGEPVVLLPPPVMSDSRPGQAATSRAIDYQLGPKREGRWRLTLEADSAWLEDPDRVWPVKLDPTMSVGPTLDCVIGGHKGQTGWIDCASWGRENLLIGYVPDLNEEEDNWWHTLMDLETSALPETAAVASATFNAHSIITALNTSGVELRQLTKPWTWKASWSRYDGPENLWETEGGDYNELGDEVLTSERGNQVGWWQFDVPPAIVEEEAEEGGNLGMILKLLDDKDRECGESSCTERKLMFDSSTSEEEEHRPYLSVLYDTTPTVTAGYATDLRLNEAILRASVDPEGLPTTYQFEYGTTTSYGSSAPASPKEAGSEFGAVEVSEPVTGLEPGTTYHFRLAATSGGGTTYGADREFTTPVVEPPRFALAFGEEGSGEGQLQEPHGIASDSEGNVWVADTGNGRIEGFDSEGGYLGKFGFFSAQPTDVALNPEGDFWASYGSFGCILKFAGGGEGTLLDSNCEPASPAGIDIDSEGNIWVADPGEGRIMEFDSKGDYLSEFSFLGLKPTDVALDAEGDFWASYEGFGGCVLEFTGEEGEFLASNCEVTSPAGLDIDSEGNVWVIDAGESRIVELDSEAELVNQLGEEKSGEGQLDEPWGLDIDSEGNLWIADTGNNRVQGWLLASGPDTTITEGPSGPIATSTASFSFTSSEEGASFECSLDGAQFSACESPQSYEELAEGSHTFRVRALDGESNPDPTPATRKFQVDTVAPETTIVLGDDRLLLGDLPLHGERGRLDLRVLAGRSPVHRLRIAPALRRTRGRTACVRGPRDRRRGQPGRDTRRTQLHGRHDAAPDDDRLPDSDLHQPRNPRLDRVQLRRGRINLQVLLRQS